MLPLRFTLQYCYPEGDIEGCSEFDVITRLRQRTVPQGCCAEKSLPLVAGLSAQGEDAGLTLYYVAKCNLWQNLNNTGNTAVYILSNKRKLHHDACD